MKKDRLLLVGKLALAASTAFVSVASPLNTLMVYAEETSTKFQLGAQIKEASAKSYGPGGDGDTIEASFDGKFETYTNSNYNDPSVAKPQEYVFKLDTFYNIDTVKIAPRSVGGSVGNGAPSSCQVLVSEDGGASYKQVANKTDINDTDVALTTIAFAPVKANAIKLVIDSKHSTVVATGEVEIYGSKDGSEQGLIDLQNKIKEAQALYDKFDENGYPSEYKDRHETFKKAIESAKTAAQTPGTDYSVALETLENAIETYSARDIAKLQEAIKTWEGFTSDNELIKKFDEQLKNGKKALENPQDYAQKQIDYYTINIPAKAYVVKVSELNKKYSPKKFNYLEYDASTIIDVLNMYEVTHNRTNGNYFEVMPGQGGSNPDNPGQMEGWYNEYLEAIKKMEKAADSTSFIGLTEDGLRSGKEQGHFEIISEKVREDGKTEIKVQFINDGKHAIFGEELPNSNGKTTFEKVKNIKNQDMHLEQYGEGIDHIKTSYMENLIYSEDGQGNTVVQATAVLEDDTRYISFKMDTSKSRDEVSSPWYYRLDKTAPTLELTTDTVVLNQNDAFDPKVYVTATEDGVDISDQVEIEHNVNTAQPGTYTVTYSIRDAIGNTATKTLTVKVNPRPVVLNTPPNLDVKDTTIALGSKFDPMSIVKVSDQEDDKAGLKLKVEVKGTVDTNKVGQYKLTYKVTDSQGASRTKTVTITVEDKKAGTSSESGKGTNTGAMTGMGLFASTASASAIGASILAVLKRRKDQ